MGNEDLDVLDDFYLRLRTLFGVKPIIDYDRKESINARRFIKLYLCTSVASRLIEGVNRREVLMSQLDGKFKLNVCRFMKKEYGISCINPFRELVMNGELRLSVIKELHLTTLNEDLLSDVVKEVREEDCCVNFLTMICREFGYEYKMRGEI